MTEQVTLRSSQSRAQVGLPSQHVEPGLHVARVGLGQRVGLVKPDLPGRRAACLGQIPLGLISSDNRQRCVRPPGVGPRMRVKLAKIMALVILALTIALVSYAVVASHASRASLAIAGGYIVMLGLVGSGAAIAVARDMPARVHRTLTAAFVVLSFFGAGISVVTWVFMAIGLIGLVPLTLDLVPRRWGRGAEPPRRSSNC